MTDEALQTSAESYLLDTCCIKILESYPNKSFPLTLLSNLTCCLLTVTSFDFDIITTDIHPLYVFKSHSIFPVPNYNDTNEEVQEEGNNNLERRYTLENFKNYSFPNIIWSQRADWEIAVKCITVTPVAIIAIAANVAVIRIILKARLMKNPVNMFILNMSIADLLLALFFPWFILVSDLSQTFLLGECICRVEGFVLLSLMLASVLSLTVISYDRLTAVVFPFKKRMDHYESKIVIWTVWIISFVCGTPLIIWRAYHKRQWIDFEERWCTEDIEKLRLYWLVLIILLVWIPLFILIVSYTAIVYKLDLLEKRQKDYPAQVRVKSKVIRMLFIVVIMFTFCWVPFSVLVIIRNNLDVMKKVPSYVRHMLFVSHFLMFINSAINPIIYGLKNDNLRREIRLATPSFFRPKETCEIATLYNGSGCGGNGPRIIKNWHRHGNKKEHLLWSNTSSYDANNPATIVSLKRSTDQMQDLDANRIPSRMNRISLPD